MPTKNKLQPQPADKEHPDDKTRRERREKQLRERASQPDPDATGISGLSVETTITPTGPKVSIQSDGQPVKFPSGPDMAGWTTAKKLDYYRKQCGLTVEKLAEKVNIEKGNVGKHLNNPKIKIRPGNLKEYARVFTEEGCPVSVKDLL